MAATAAATSSGFDPVTVPRSVTAIVVIGGSWLVAGRKDAMNNEAPIGPASTARSNFAGPPRAIGR
jgi:hypothetical protein